MDIRAALEHLRAGNTLNEEEAHDVFDSLLKGELDAAQIGALLSLLATHVPTVSELVGAARVMRENVHRVPADVHGPPIVDTCGTGGAPKTFNVSTIAAILAVAAAPGQLRIAKHGNRSRTGRGSAELLAALGVNVDADTDEQARTLDRAGVCFCFAIHHHPAVRHAMPARKALGFTTIFNLLGPLTNPAGATRQVLGVSHASFVRPVAEALHRLGASRAIVVHGDDGLDEITTTAPTRCAVVERSGVCERFETPESMGVARASLGALGARDLDHAATIAREILGGKASPLFDIASVNAGAALMVAGVVDTIHEGAAMVRASRGNGLEVLEKMKG